MILTYDELLAAQLRYGTTADDIRKNDDFYMVLPNVVIAPWWEVTIFNNYDLEINKINDKVYNLKNNEIEFSFIQVKQVGAPAIIEEILSLGVTKCKNLLFVGSAGALKENIHIGDIVVPSLSICGDGASRYLNTDLKDDFGKIIEPDEKLTSLLYETAKAINVDSDVQIHNVKNFSVDSVFGQFPHLGKILSLGSEVIEMETYSLFKSAKIANIKASALFCISDNTVIKKSLYSGRTEEDKIKKKTVKTEIIPKIIIEWFKKIN